MREVRIGTRGSALALVQAGWVKDALEKVHPEVRCTLVTIKTSGDSVPGTGTVPGTGSALKGLFVKEIEEALLEGRIDLAVHSAKDMETDLPAGLKLAAVPEREDPRDALVAPDGVTFRALPAGARVGVNSLRRIAQLKRLRRDLEYVPIRGNVDTRLRKLEAGEVKALVLAGCGLKRLGLESSISEWFDLKIVLSAPGQGALAVESREDRADLHPLLGRLDHAHSHQEVLAERAFLKAMGGSCRVPIGAFARTQGGQVTLEATVLSPDGLRMIRRENSGSERAAEKIGEELASHLRAAGADRLLYGIWAERYR